MKLKFSKANTKLAKGANGRKMYSFALPSGHSCPFAKDCKSLAERETGTITDGPDTQFRCYAASLEALYPQLRRMVWHNYDLLRKAKTTEAMTQLIERSIPADAQIIRIHVGGDFFNFDYMSAWVQVAMNNPDILFYAYTKSLGYWAVLKQYIPSNLKLNASRGGSRDYLIQEEGFKEVVVVMSQEEADELGLETDDNDTHAYEQDNDFALVIHGTQPAGTAAAAAWAKVKAELKAKKK